ncbi:thioesterase family protein [Gordonia sp. TBRC 11910]|uniref:Thioesterase family protein n=1 Tax=Gordonia asplenii TaxID=2725283 RepID=A0A848KX70_9ACTN|nr:acyl-CoA thioesterase domain-containing protein [Gordonia asplenii]NMO03230.1 thioesterase family protein [Gordonia asplenii]
MTASRPLRDHASPPAPRHAFFERNTGGAEELFTPLPLARSGWGAGQMRGMAVSALLARGVESAAAQLQRSAMQPARWTLDLFRPAAMEPTAVHTEVVRAGRRLCLIDASLQQGSTVVARASALLLCPTEAESGLWRTTESPQPPPAAPADPLTERIYRSETGWLPAGDTPADDGRKGLWQFGTPTVDGEPLTPFQAVAGVADLINASANLGSRGLEFINADASLNLSRLPSETDVGLQSLVRTEDRGVMTATAIMFDRAGPFGTVTMSGLANKPIPLELPQP